MPTPEALVEDSIPAVCSLAREAGRILLARRPWCVSTRKPDLSVLTEVDQEVQALLIEGLTHCLPGFAIIAEESGWDGIAPAGAPALWIDPCDGTRLYVDGGDDWSVCVGAAGPGGEPLLGLILQPARGHLFLWTPARGATRDGIPLPPLVASDAPAGAYLYVHSDAGAHLPALPAPLKITALGATSAHFVRLFEDRAGRVLALMLSRYGRWDLCAGPLQIAAALGARFRDLSGAALTPETLLANSMRLKRYEPTCLVGHPRHLDALLRAPAGSPS